MEDYLMKEYQFRGHSRCKRIASLLLAVAMSASVVTAAGAITQADIDATAAKIQEMQSQQASLQSQQADVQSQLDALTQQENSAVDQLLLYQQQAELLESQIDNTKEIIDDYETQIADTQVKLEEAQEKEAQYYDLFCERVRSMEENSSMSYWSILFNAESFSDLLDRLSFISEVMDYDNWVMEQLEEARQEVADTKTQLEEEKAGKEEALVDLENQEAQVQEAYDQMSVQLEEIRANESVYADKMAQLTSLTESLEDDIVQSQATYESQIAALQKQIEEAEAKKKAEEEAKRKAEEEAKQKAEEEAKRKAEEEAAAAAAAEANKNNSSSSSSESTSSSDSASSSESSSSTSSSESSSSGSTSSSESSSSSSSSSSSESTSTSSGNSALGAEIASYGCQFIGNPYVYGGTSLTNGTDCSGFVMRVYEHFGYSVPRTTSGLRSVGRSVSYSDAQPGDIIVFYSSASPSGGHCGIYIGNGMMVNAASTKTGIVISSVNPNRAGFVVRRVV
jgi:cell wall-associated NlpC family hydrolase/peptidoglycan hydrolase CwlO-like protein